MAEYSINKYDFNSNTYLLEDNRLSDSDINKLSTVSGNAAAVTLIDSTSGSPTTTNLSELIINKLTQAQYNALTSPNSNQLYMITDDTIYAEKSYVDNLIPSQSGNSGKFLTTNGSVASWADNPPELFWITLNKSALTANKTFTEIQTAYNAGKMPMVKADNTHVFSFLYIYPNNYIRFSRLIGDSAECVKINSDNTWEIDFSNKIDNLFVITVTSSNNVLSANKTYVEIQAAIADNKEVIVKMGEYTFRIHYNLATNGVAFTSIGYNNNGPNELILTVDPQNNWAYLTTQATCSTIGALPLTGGTMSGNIVFGNNNIGVQRIGRSLSWHKGRDGALVKTTTIDGYGTLASLKTNNGSWDIGVYNNSSYADDLLFSYVTDSLYNGSSAATTAQIKFLENGTIVGNLQGNVTGNCSGSSGSCTGNAATATSATNATNATYLLTATNPGTAPTYGVNRLEYFNSSNSAGAAANAIDAPTADWYHHLRMNHANGSGYYVDIAPCFHNDNIYWKRVSGGAVSNNKWMHIWVEGNAVTSAVWNDYAEYRETDTQEFGRCVIENGDDTMSLSTKRLQKGCSITSDTWGFAQGQTEKAKTPIAVSGRVLAYPFEDKEEFRKHIGDAVCSGPEGTVSIMTDEEVQKYPLSIIGTISAVPDYEEWGGGSDRGPVKVNGRVWIRIK